MDLPPSLSRDDGATILGLTDVEVEDRRRTHGANVLARPPHPSLPRLVLGQLGDPMTGVLLAAALATAFVLREYMEAAAIGTIVVVDALLGGIQTARANLAVDALDDVVAPSAMVWRSGSLVELPASEVVVDDLVEVALGDRVPADAVVIAAGSLEVDESLMTGESLPVPKSPRGDDEVDAEPCHLWAGSLVAGGRGRARVVAVGAHSGVGEIAASLQQRGTTPLEADMAHVARRLGLTAGVIGVAFGSVTYLRSTGGGEAAIDAILAGVSLAVAAVPEGLSAVVTVALAIGARRMARRGAIVRRLDAVETLGATDVLCTDKTGTLTTGELSLVAVHSTDGLHDDLWAAAVRCNDATDGLGDPLDVALVAAASEAGVTEPDGLRVAEAPFDAVRRMHTVVHRTDDGPLLSVKGAPSSVLARCEPGPNVHRWNAEADRLAARGWRVLALADGPTAELGAKGLRALGLMSFGDPLRTTTRNAVADCRRAGIRVVLVTGDHPATARAIAIEAGLDVATVVTGDELAKLELESSDRARRLRAADVVARVTPAVKSELLAAHQQDGHVVAMTGDGVNDAPALRRAEVGVAIAGGVGTAVAREAADLIVTDGNLGTIVAAIREGRRTFRNLVSVISYLLTGNVAEIVVVVATIPILDQLAVPLTPVQLLWINVVTDGLPAVALGTDLAPGDPLDEAPRSHGDRLLDRQRVMEIIGRGALLGGSLVALARWAVGREVPQATVATQLVLGLVLAQLALPFVVRSRRWAFESGWAANRRLLAVLGGTLALQVGVFGSEQTRSLLDLTALGWAEWAQVAGCLAMAFTAIEAYPRLTRR